VKRHDDRRRGEPPRGFAEVRDIVPLRLRALREDHEVGAQLRRQPHGALRDVRRLQPRKRGVHPLDAQQLPEVRGQAVRRLHTPPQRHRIPDDEDAQAGRRVGDVWV
jgi:hypothetical protein